MGLPHGRRDAVAPFDVEFAEPAVAVAGGMMSAIFFPQQRQRHAAAAQLGMNMPPFRQRLRSGRVVAGRREQLAFQRRIVELFGHRPSDADDGGAADVFPDRGAADPHRPCDHTLARPVGILQAQNFSNLPHRQSLGGHRASFANRKEGPCPAQTADSAPRLTLSTGWPHCLGIGGRFRSEWVAAFRRNRWPHCLGFRTRLQKIKKFTIQDALLGGMRSPPSNTEWLLMCLDAPLGKKQMLAE